MHILSKGLRNNKGTAHEYDGLEPALVDLNSIFINGIEPFVAVLATDAELTLEIGERVLEHVEQHLGLKRQHHKSTAIFQSSSARVSNNYWPDGYPY